MYCPSCGTEVTMSLNYCNRCGANLSPSANLPEQIARPVSLTGPTVAVALMVVIGLGIVFAGAVELSTRGIHPAVLTWIVLGSLGMIMGIAALLIRQWSNLAGLAKTQPAPRKQAKESTLPPAPSQLPPMRTEPAASVTEHTTRTFEPVKGKEW